MKEKKVLMVRVVLILVCLAIFVTCFWAMNQTYDPLARYPYATEENRETILQHLDSEDIEYIISNQIRPEEFLEFIDEPGFDVRYCRLYTIAKQTQDESNAYIVNFVNRYRSHFSMSTLETLLQHYSYLDLTTFYENELASHENLALISDPSSPLIVLNDSTSVYKYVPDDLTSIQGVSLKEEAAQAFQNMEEAYRSMIGQDQSLSLEKGYIPYDHIFTEYTSWNALNAQYCDEVFLPAGQNEFQLGYTVALTGYNDWVCQCLEKETIYRQNQYDEILETYDETMIQKITWLEDNAYRYGFVIRYPQGKEEQTGQLYNPFVLRYVGQENAKTMRESDKVMEEMKLEELE